MKIRELKVEVKNIQRSYQKLQQEVDELIWSLAPMASPELRRRLGADPDDSEAVSTRTRPHYSDKVKQQVKAALQEGLTAEAASRKLGPSPFTIKLWKREWGLSKPRAKKKNPSDRATRA